MANNTLIGALRAEATLESGKFVDGAKKIRKEAKQTETQLKSSFSAMGAAVKGFGGALTAGLSIGLLGGLAKKALDFATSIKDVSAQAGVSTKALQEFRYAASQMGIQQAEADRGLTKLNETLGKAAAGSSSAQKALAAVGVTMADVKTKSRTEIFGQIADQMIKQGGAAKNAAAANAIFGESAAKLNPLLDKGSQGVNELAQAANRLGVVLSDEQIQQADETARKLDDVRRVLSAQIAGVVADNAGSIVTLAQALASLTSAVVNFLGSNPQLALAIIGGLAGSRVGGLPGAAAGALTGFAIGGNVAEQQALARSRNDVGLLRHNTAQLRDQLLAKRKAGQPVKQSELERLQRLTAKLNAATGNVPSVGGTGSIPQFLASAPKGGGRKRTPRAPRDRSDDVAFQFDQELKRAHADVLRAQQQLATTSDERASIALQLLDVDRSIQEAELNDRVRRAERDFAEGRITEGTLEQVKVQAEQLRAEYDSRDALERKAIADDLAADKARDAAALRDQDYEFQLERLQLDAALANSSRERRDIELRILDVMKQQEKARLEAVIADKQSSELAKEEARRRLAQLDSIYAKRTNATLQGTAGPLEQFQTQFSDITDEMEQLKVQGIMGAVDALTALTEGFDNFRDVALNAIKQVIAELIRLQLMKLAANLIGTAAGVPSAGSAINVTGLSSNPGSIFGGLPDFAGGGGFNIKGVPGVDRNTLSLNGLPIANVSYGERVSVSNDNAAPIPPFVFNNYARMSATEARQTGAQAAAGFRREIAKANRKGM